MNPHVHAIGGRLSLRAPQKESLEILAEVTQLLPPNRDTDVEEALEELQAKFPQVKSFERDFVSLCFALATGVGKTRLMGAFISYLHLQHGLKHFFVLAPNLTIYNKLIEDFRPGSKKYVFKGISAFAINAPEVITGETYDQKGGLLDRPDAVQINIFNISKINSEVRGGKSPRIRKLSEYLGQSYFDYLAGLPDLVMLMDESHRYRASAGIRAINELRPVLGLELTATPFVESPKGPVAFRNVIYDYPLARAMEDGFVKEPAVVTRKNFSTTGLSPDEIETIKLEDGVRVHEETKVELNTWSLQTGMELVKPFMLVIARDTSHAGQLIKRIQGTDFFGGRYAGKVIQVDSSKTGAEEEEMVQRLLKVEDRDEPTEIVVHVNMLKEGWDVTNLYTIVPLRAANARTLIEQSIGRGLRLPYGRRTGHKVVDGLNIIAHDRFQEIIDEANRSDSPIRMRERQLEPEDLAAGLVSVPVEPNILARLSTPAPTPAPSPGDAPARPQVSLTVSQSSPEALKVAETVRRVIVDMAKETAIAPTTESLKRPEVRAEIEKRTQTRMEGTQLALPGMTQVPDLKAIVAEITNLVAEETIDIPRIVVLPKGEAHFVFDDFELDLRDLNYQPVDDALYYQYLRTSERRISQSGSANASEARLENHLVRRLMDFKEVDYEDTAELLYKLAGQATAHFSQRLGEADAAKVVRYYERQIAKNIYLQMMQHFRVEAEGGFETSVSQGYDELRKGGFSGEGEQRNLRDTVIDKKNIRRYLFSGFQRCLYPVQKFDSDPERKLALILERDAEKWFKPLGGQFQIYYAGADGQKLYVPDFVAETETSILLLEVKDRSELGDPIVQAKREAAEAWCAQATAYSVAHGGKAWRYRVLAGDGITENMGLEGLVG